MREDGEIALARAVICQAVIDACSAHPGGSPVVGGPQAIRMDRDIARAWLTRPSADLQTICDLAELEQDAILTRGRCLRGRGWPAAAILEIQQARASG